VNAVNVVNVVNVFVIIFFELILKNTFISYFEMKGIIMNDKKICGLPLECRDSPSSKFFFLFTILSFSFTLIHSLSHTLFIIENFNAFIYLISFSYFSLHRVC
jgi:hypothetical protein